MSEQREIPNEALAHIAEHKGFKIYLIGGVCIAGTRIPRNHQLGIAVQCRPRPHVTGSFHFVRYVLLLGIDEGPDLIALKVLHSHLPHRLIVELLASAAYVHKQLRYGVDRHIANAGRAAKAAAFNEHADDLDLLGDGEAVHGVGVLMGQT